MAKWIDVGAPEQFPEGEPVCAEAGNLPVVVCQVKGQFYAIENVCPHAGMPLDEGELAGRVITCPYHGYAYDVVTGRNIDFPQEELPVQTFETRVQDEQVQVHLQTPKKQDEPDEEKPARNPNAADGDDEAQPDQPPEGYPDKERSNPAGGESEDEVPHPEGQ